MAPEDREDWLGDDPFGGGDPAAADRERRRREREERRRAEGERPAGAASSTRPPFFRRLSRLAAGMRPRPGARRLGALGGLGAVALLGVAALAYAYLDRDEPPPPPELRTIALTVPEGLARPQTAELAAEAGLRGDYMRASLRSPRLDPARYGGEEADSLEGFLFPDTFELEARAPVRDLVRLQVEDFKRRVAGVDLAYARSKNLTLYDVVTIASMVEEEAMMARERGLIAAVIYNRLREGMPLGIDATVRFATGNYTQPLTESELAVDSPYNTRLHAGLPPGPISSPGLAAIEAAARPADVDHLYYVVKPGTCGEHAFSATEAEFQADVARYEEAREAAGGESPDTCPG